jgi:hypothetical protein
MERLTWISFAPYDSISLVDLGPCLKISSRGLLRPPEASMPTKKKLKNASIAERSAALPWIPQELLDQIHCSRLTYAAGDCGLHG